MCSCGSSCRWSEECSAGASIHEPPELYNNWPSIFWRSFILIVITVVLNFLATFFFSGRLEQQPSWAYVSPPDRGYGGSFRRLWKSDFQLISRLRLRPGPDLLSAGPCSEKNVRPLNWCDRPYFFWNKNWRPFLVSPSVCHQSILLKKFFLLITLVSLGGRSPTFPACKNFRSFCGAPFRSAEYAEHA